MKRISLVARLSLDWNLERMGQARAAVRPAVSEAERRRRKRRASLSLTRCLPCLLVVLEVEAGDCPPSPPSLHHHPLDQFAIRPLLLYHPPCYPAR